MKKLFLILLLCPLLSRGQDTNTQTDNLQRQKKGLHRFEATVYAGGVYYNLPNTEMGGLTVNLNNKTITALTHGVSFKVNPTLAFYITRHWNVGATYSHNNMYYRGQDQQENTVRVKYVQDVVSYGLFSNYYFGSGRLQPFAGINFASLRARVMGGFMMNDRMFDARGYTYGVNAGLRYNISANWAANLMEQGNNIFSMEGLSTFTYSTMAGISYRF